MDIVYRESDPFEIRRPSEGVWTRADTLGLYETPELGSEAYAFLAALSYQLASGDGEFAFSNESGATAACPEPFTRLLGTIAEQTMTGKQYVRIDFGTTAPNESTDVSMQAVENPKEYISTGVAAGMLGIARPTLVRLLESGAIPYIKPGTARKIKLTDVQAYIAKTTHLGNDS